jgi:hypothetical protein
MQTKGRSLAEPDRSDVDLAAREITVRGKGGRSRTVKRSYEAARRLDRYLRARSRHQLAWRPELWLREGTPGAAGAESLLAIWQQIITDDAAAARPFEPPRMS